MQLVVVLVGTITALITVSNTLSIALLVTIALDPCSLLQGVDYCIFSLALSDLLAGLLIGPFSIMSFEFQSWRFGDLLCKTIGFAMFALWAVNVNSLFWLSVDRLLYITDYKYCTYKQRTRARCICKIILSWIMSALFSLVPLIVNKNASFLPHSAVCVIDWFTVEAYYLTVTSIVIVPCLTATLFNYGRIFFWRIQYGTGFLKLKAANVEYLLEPTNVMALVLTLVFWCSWLPYMVHLIQYKVLGPRTPAFGDIWTGFAQSVWKFPIMVTLCPRYRGYLGQWCCRTPSQGVAGDAGSDAGGLALNGWTRFWLVVGGEKRRSCGELAIGSDGPDGGKGGGAGGGGVCRLQEVVFATTAKAAKSKMEVQRRGEDWAADEEIYM